MNRRVLFGIGLLTLSQLFGCASMFAPPKPVKDQIDELNQVRVRLAALSFEVLAGGPSPGACRAIGDLAHNYVQQRDQLFAAAAQESATWIQATQETAHKIGYLGWVSKNFPYQMEYVQQAEIVCIRNNRLAKGPIPGGGL